MIFQSWYSSIAFYRCWLLLMADLCIAQRLTNRSSLRSKVAVSTMGISNRWELSPSLVVRCAAHVLVASEAKQKQSSLWESTMILRSFLKEDVVLWLWFLIFFLSLTEGEFAQCNRGSWYYFVQRTSLLWKSVRRWLRVKFTDHAKFWAFWEESLSLVMFWVPDFPPQTFATRWGWCSPNAPTLRPKRLSHP